MCRQILAICLLLPVTALGATGQTVVFKKQPAQVGDQSRQTIDCDLDLVLSIRQAGQTVQAQNQGIQRRQLRELTILTTGKQAPVKARVTYNESSVALQTTPDDAVQAAPQPVTGKTYLVIRDAGVLSIKYADGKQPPKEEVAIVTQNMQSFGLPNPIARFFDGRSLRIGQTVQLPKEVAQELLGSADTVRDISQFNLRLKELRNIKQQPCAVFDLKLIADNGQTDSLKMDLSGSMVMEVNTCRTVAVQLSGPVGASEIHGPPTAQFEVASEGKIRVAVRADYGKPVR